LFLVFCFLFFVFLYFVFPSFGTGPWEGYRSSFVPRFNSPPRFFGYWGGAFVPPSFRKTNIHSSAQIWPLFAEIPWKPPDVGDGIRTSFVSQERIHSSYLHPLISLVSCFSSPLTFYVLRFLVLPKKVDTINVLTRVQIRLD
jgi:hypothetical protein